MMSAAPGSGSLDEATRRVYLSEMGIDLYLDEQHWLREREALRPQARASVAAGAEAARAAPASPESPSRPPTSPQRSNAGVARFPLADLEPQAPESASVQPQRAGAAAVAGTDPGAEAKTGLDIRCFGSSRAGVALLLQMPGEPPSINPLSMQMKRSLGVLLAALELSPGQVMVLCLAPDVALERVNTSLPATPRLLLGFGLEPAFAEALPVPCLSVDSRLPPAHASAVWKRRIWPALRLARRRLGLRVV